MRQSWIPPIAAAALACAGCTWVGGVGEGGACIAMVDYRHHSYLADTMTSGGPLIGYVLAAHRHRLGTGVLPACNDTGPGQQSQSGIPVHLDRIDGVDPAQAVASAGDGTVWVRLRAAEPVIPPSWLGHFAP